MSPSLRPAASERDSIFRPVASRGASASIIACMIDGTPAMTWTLPIVKPGAFETEFSISVAPSGIRAMRSRASLSWSFGMRSRSSATARGSTSIGTPKALATELAVMSSWVGPMPPVVKTWS